MFTSLSPSLSLSLPLSTIVIVSPIFMTSIMGALHTLRVPYPLCSPHACTSSHNPKSICRAHRLFLIVRSPQIFTQSAKMLRDIYDTVRCSRVLRICKPAHDNNFNNLFRWLLALCLSKLFADYLLSHGGLRLSRVLRIKPEHSNALLKIVALMSHGGRDFAFMNI